MDQDRLKSLILSQDQELDNVLFAAKDEETEKEPNGPWSPVDSHSSLYDEDLVDGEGLEVTVWLPVWSRKRCFKVLLVSSSHPSFLVLHLHPVSRPNGSRNRSVAGSYKHTGARHPDSPRIRSGGVVSSIGNGLHPHSAFTVSGGAGRTDDMEGVETPTVTAADTPTMSDSALCKSSMLLQSWMGADPEVAEPVGKELNVEMKKRLQEMDWASTPMGPVSLFFAACCSPKDQGTDGLLLTERALAGITRNDVELSHEHLGPCVDM